MAYFNENNPYAAQWLRNLWPEAIVDERSIREVERVDEPRAHFFAGIGGWEYALDLAGWPRDRPVWTGSCPCQPFSAAGKQQGEADERHLWPEFRRLIAECRPATVFGEQVASKLGRGWLAGVRADLEALGYAVGAADLCAASAGAPHIRQRLFWVADATRQQHDRARYAGTRGWIKPSDGRHTRGLAVAAAERLQGWRDGHPGEQKESVRLLPGGPSLNVGAWADPEWLACTDGKARRTQSSLFPLAHGVSNRVGRLRAYGNAIVPQVAATFIRAFLDTEEGCVTRRLAEGGE